MKIKICVGTTCNLMGAPALIETLNSLDKNILGKVELEYATCFSYCQGKMVPPVVEIDSNYFENVTPDKLKRVILEKIKTGE